MQEWPRCCDDKTSKQESSLIHFNLNPCLFMSASSSSISSDEMFDGKLYNSTTCENSANSLDCFELLWNSFEFERWVCGDCEPWRGECVACGNCEFSRELFVRSLRWSVSSKFRFSTCRFSWNCPKLSICWYFDPPRPLFIISCFGLSFACSFDRIVCFSSSLSCFSFDSSSFNLSINSHTQIRSTGISTDIPRLDSFSYLNSSRFLSNSRNKKFETKYPSGFSYPLAKLIAFMSSATLKTSKWRISEKHGEKNEALAHDQVL